MIGCDPATGGDENVSYYVNNGKILDSMILYERDEMKIVGHYQIFANKHNIKDFAIDSIGLGGGICSRLKELGYNVQRLDSRNEAQDKEKFFNKRAEMWWNAMMMINDKEIPYIEDAKLRQQLTSVRFVICDSNGKIKLEPKEETKKRLGCSPDRADAFVYALWGMRKAEFRNVRDFHMKDKFRRFRDNKRNVALRAGVGSY
jgi:hypothetical protein